ncbi:uncharacterized protein LOC132544066 [Ylistrum balloti]|uniref:uncharacterized protein LOC132544066 n=1 Tax=Ylistrum balloti TaxID=509963 RepID=UPI0029058335|nr:uncharacterized protein LOC132544066 [Ylistrum balloti]
MPRSTMPVFSSIELAATVKSQSNKENTKPTQEPAQQTLVKENVQKNNGKFVATYTRTRPERKKENNKIDNNKERVDVSPQSRTTDDTITDSNVSKGSPYRWHAPARKYETTRQNPPVKPKAVTINSDSASSRTTGSSNKPPVFKLKLHKKPMYSRDKKAKEKEVVITPRTHKSSQDSSRPKSYHLERDKSIYRTNTYLWEEEKAELTYQPSTNTQTDVMMAYTGEPNTREALKSASGKKRPKEFKKAFTVFATRSKQPPWHENEYVLNRREAQIYQGIKQVYDKPTAKKARQREFMKKLEQFQVEMAKHQMNELQQKETKKYMDKMRQANQLKELRQRFEDEAWHRFHTQYVTSRVLEHEKMNRFQYGLPEEPDGEPEYAVKLKRKKKNPKVIIDGKQLSKINKKRFSDMFDVNTGPQWSTNSKDPRMEGIDTVVLDVKDDEGGVIIAPKEEGNIKEKKKFVKDVIQEAQKELKIVHGNGNNTGLTPRSPVVEDAPTVKTDQRQKTPDFYAEESESDDDDDMSDIFERARKKYNLEVDEEADSVSRAR